MRRFILIFLCLLFLMPSLAQEDTPLPVLSAEDVFVEGVIPYIAALPILKINNEEKIAHYFEPSLMQWVDYAYPFTELEFQSNVVRRSDNTFVLYENSAIYLTHYIADENVWLFDAEQGFYQVEPICGLLPAVQGDGQWRFTKNGDSYQLCNDETGELGGAIPHLFSSRYLSDDCLLAYRDYEYHFSPSSEWLLFRNCDTPSNQSLPSVTAYTIFAYNLEDKQFYGIGQLDYASSINIQWIADTEALIFAYVDGLDWFDGLPVREFVQQRAYVYHVSLDSLRLEYLFETEVSSYGFRYTDDGWLKWVIVNSNSHLMRYQIPQGSIERHFETDCNNFACEIIFETARLIGIVELSNTLGDLNNLYIYDKESGTLVFQERVDAWSLLGYSLQESIIFYAYDDASNQMVLRDLNLTTLQSEIVALGEANPHEARNASPNHRYWLLHTSEQWQVYDSQQDLIFPITLSQELSYRLILSPYWVNNNVLQVDVLSNTQSWGNPLQSWQIRIDALMEENS